MNSTKQKSSIKVTEEKVDDKDLKINQLKAQLKKARQVISLLNDTYQEIGDLDKPCIKSMSEFLEKN